VKIAYLAASPIPSGVASSVQVMRMCQGLARLGHEVTLFAPLRAEIRPDVADPFGFYGVEPDFTFRRVAWHAEGRGMLLCAGVMAWAARGTRPDLVYGRFPEAVALSAELGLPVVLEAHLPLRTTGPLGWLRRRLLDHRNLRRLVVVSDALGREYRERHRVDGTRVVVAPDAAEDPGDTPVDPLGPPGRLQAVYVGNVYPGKGVETVVELAEACPWADFHVVGGEATQLETWSEPAARLPNLRLHGHVPHGQTDRYRLGADVLLAPYHGRVGTHGAGEASRWMSPLKLFEYMAAGRAILVSDLPVLREVVRDEVQVLLCQPEHTAAWVAALRRLADDPALRERLGRAARAEFLRAHTWVARARTALHGLTSEPTRSA
jgi:glycosyltransferase involved in cell wall biosynthesis